jgi:hypothetical protein
MSMPAATAKKWTCDRCGVSVSRLDGGSSALPDTWTSSGEGRFCLGCRRERAAEAVLEAAPSDTTRDARVRLRRSAVIEFELRRTPDHADNAIAKTCHTSAPAVAEARQRLRISVPTAPSPKAGATDRVAGRR